MITMNYEYLPRSIFGKHPRISRRKRTMFSVVVVDILLATLEGKLGRDIILESLGQ